MTLVCQFLEAWERGWLAAAMLVLLASLSSFGLAAILQNRFLGGLLSFGGLQLLLTTQHVVGFREFGDSWAIPGVLMPLVASVGAAILARPLRLCRAKSR